MNERMAGILRGATKSLSVRELRKAKIDSVQVIERSRFVELMKQLEETEQAETAAPKSKSGSKDPTQRRLERLLHENAKLGKDKKELEHAKGLVEAERGRLQAALDEVTQALGREVGSKLQEEDLKGLLKERAKLRQQVAGLETNLKKLQNSARDRMDEELSRNAELERKFDVVSAERDELARERDRFDDEIEALRHDLEQFRDERDRMVDERDSMASERDAFREERDKMRRERDAFREERDGYLKRSATLGEELAALRRELENARTEVAELAHALEADAAQLAELTTEKRQLTQQLAEYQAKEEAAQAEAEAEAAKAEASPAVTARPSYERKPSSKKSKPGKQDFGFGFGFGGKGR